MRSDGRGLDPHTIRKHLVGALDTAKVPKMTWYQATRHTFASHWVMQEGAIEKLREVVGHSSVTITERYSHLKPELFSDKDRGLMAVDLAPGKVVSKARGGGAA